MTKFTRGPIPVRVTRRPPAENGLVAVTCAADPETGGYKVAYRGTAEQVIACLEAVQHKLWALRATDEEPEVTQ